MIKTDLNNMSYPAFLDFYVEKAYIPYTIVFRYKGRVFELDNCGNDPTYQPVAINSLKRDKSTYEFFELIDYDKGENHSSSRQGPSYFYRSLKRAITDLKIDGASFQEIYDSPDSEIIDIS
jgi:hypothetical protein